MEYTLIDKNSVGLASELIVAAKLIKCGYQVSLTLGHTKSVDIHASKDGINYSIQVKGCQKNKGKSKSCSWRINKSDVLDYIIYVFVNLNMNIENSKEDSYIIEGKDLICLVSGSTPQEYVYSSKLAKYLEMWNLSMR
ncbi:MAG: hypothetical protein PHW83_09270 [Bacteroidales bacterium]|nr:hypothetical protein [Bacteroidales bacterium]